MALRCLVVDDDDFTRVTLQAALQSEGFEVAASVSSAEDAIRFIRSNSVDVATLDLDLGPGPTGIDLAFGIRRLRPTVGIVLLTSFSDPRLLASSARELPEGATYVVKQSLTDIGFLSEAIRGAAGPDPAEQATTAEVPLSDAQVETLRLLAYGLSNDQIAQARFVSRKSVEQTIRRIADALGVGKETGNNLRVALAREYFRLTGATRHIHV
ncbi:MAG TPA: response regulator transcription factor [Candidatus Nanopelagicales bacterium]|nr:response regulator transcription factor [Candidatus Nanopelagicales bacterium]